eukprot:CAMPEP_0168462520 /NCGR_PEP_ID=MMETSP0228-20121227/54563_1 /TAXON_ID=133427 /ORGANISM="Protoceratium reticulatum, Strain CCCM 535 (=CCMP 1889)" /LENGTH=243 /DNA_ID=CAMNT_0008477909 /DNA_START=306 /DNA_END=1038 /DNA_ORIENTATION=-
MRVRRRPARGKAHRPQASPASCRSSRRAPGSLAVHKVLDSAAQLRVGFFHGVHDPCDEEGAGATNECDKRAEPNHRQPVNPPPVFAGVVARQLFQPADKPAHRRWPKCSKQYIVYIQDDIKSNRIQQQLRHRRGANEKHCPKHHQPGGYAKTHRTDQAHPHEATPAERHQAVAALGGFDTSPGVRKSPHDADKVVDVAHLNQNLGAPNHKCRDAHEGSSVLQDLPPVMPTIEFDVFQHLRPVS